MDRIDAMAAFVATVDAGGLSAAARQLGRSPASITRAVAFLEARTGSQLLRRTTRSIKLTEAGAAFVASCRRILGELGEAELALARERESPRGLLTVTAPVLFGRLHVRPVVDAFVSAHRDVEARFLLLDRVVDLVDEGADVAIRIAHMPDSALIATKVGAVRRVTCASPSYLAKRRAPAEPAALAGHDCIAFSQGAPGDVWSFGPGPEGGRPRRVRLRPRVSVNSADASVASAVDGRGITRVLSYQVEAELRDGRLVRVLEAFDAEPIPVHVVYPAASVGAAKIRAFVDLVVPALRAALDRVASTSDRHARGARRVNRVERSRWPR